MKRGSFFPQRTFLFLAAWSAWSACANLPEVSGSVCGNSIVETPAEDCDTFSTSPGSHCRAPGESGACHLDCGLNREGKPHTCPIGWGCDFENLCRPPSGDFVNPPLTFPIGGVSTLAAGDFDGDGRVDVLSRQPRDLLGRAALSFHYFDARGMLSDTRPFPLLSAWPALGDLSNDGRVDVVFSGFELGVLLGRADRTWVPETFSPYVLPDVSVRMVGVYRDFVDNVPAVVALTSRAGVPGVYTPDNARGLLTLRAELAAPVEQLVGDPAIGNILEAVGSPCDELVLAYAGAAALEVFDLCTLDEPSGAAFWTVSAPRLSVELSPAAAIDAAPLVVDLNADGHLDVLIGAGGQSYAAYGDGRTLTKAVPYFPPTEEPAYFGTSFSMPLAVGDFTGDGALDFVLPDRIETSVFRPGATLPRYQVDHLNVAGRWTAAKVADLNGNGLLDVVAASLGGINIDFFNGTGTHDLIAFQVGTDRPVSHLTVGDFDGDLIGDLAFIEVASNADGFDALMIAFGAPFQKPGRAVPVARVKHAEQLGIYASQGLDGLVIASKQTVLGRSQSVLNLLDGNPARVPFAPLSLVTFAADGSLEDAGAVANVLGKFTGSVDKDLLVLSTNSDSLNWRFWMVPSLGSSSTPQRVEGALDARLAAGTRSGLNLRLDVRGVAADVDRDGRDEALWMMPSVDGTRCGIESFRVTGDSVRALSSRGVVLLEAPCMDPQLTPIDADFDGWVDLAVLTGAPQGLDRKLFVLWNDGAGNFSASAMTRVSAVGDAPQAFASLGAISTRPFGFAYVTERAVMQALSTGSRTFAPPKSLLTLRRGSGIVAADLNGDRATDLAVADDGDLTILQAELRRAP